MPSRRRHEFHAIALASACALTTSSRVAHAGALSANFSFDSDAAWIPRLPPVQLNDPTATPARTIQPGTAPLAGGAFVLRTSIALGLVISDRVLIPLSSIAIGGVVGHTPDVATSLDGSTFVAQPAAASMFRVDLPGIGVRFHSVRWMFAARVIPAFEYWMVPASFTQDTTALLTAMTVSLRADLEGCFRIDPSNRLCAFVAPSLLEFTVLNGGSVGLRMEFGP